MQGDGNEIARYALYGEAGRSVAPEFLHLEDIPSRSALYDWVIAPHAHPGLFQILMVTAGSARVDCDGVASALTAPAVICVPGSCVHAFAFSAGTQGWVLSIAQDLLGDPRVQPFGAGLLIQAPQGRVVSLAHDGAASTRLDWLLGDMALRMASEHGAVPAMVIAELACVLGVVTEVLGPGADAPGPVDRRVQIVRAYEALVDQHFRDHLPITDYAARLGVAPPTLTRACRAVLGKAPGDVLLDRLILEAMRYLRHTAASAKQIGGRLGFADPAYFVRFFKQRSGMTTRQFRKGLRSPLDPRPDH
jgi:AraC family transcriptional activator of pobA